MSEHKLKSVLKSGCDDQARLSFTFAPQVGALFMVVGGTYGLSLPLWGFLCDSKVLVKLFSFYQLGFTRRETWSASCGFFFSDDKEFSKVCGGGRRNSYNRWFSHTG